MQRTALRQAIESVANYDKKVKLDKNKPVNRLDGTDSLNAIYREDTPGQIVAEDRIIVENDLSDERNSDLHKHHYKMGHLYNIIGHVLKERTPNLAADMFARAEDHHNAASTYGRDIDPELRKVRESDAKNSAMDMLHTAHNFA